MYLSPASEDGYFPSLHTSRNSEEIFFCKKWYTNENSLFASIQMIHSSFQDKV